MTRMLTAKIALFIAAFSSCAMGAYHFFLPHMFHWDNFVKKIPSVIQWALFSINFFFSFLLLAGGVLTFVALRRLHRSLPPDRGVLVAMAGFWIANTLYQLRLPSHCFLNAPRLTRYARAAKTPYPNRTMCSSHSLGG